MTNETISNSVKLAARLYLKLNEILKNWDKEVVPYNIYYFKEGIKK